jgi:hypothetical protein
MEQFNRAASEYEYGTSPDTTAENNFQPEVPEMNSQGSRAAFANAR